MVEIFKQYFGQIRLAHVSLVFAGLMLVLPFQYYYHQYPLTAFYQEGTAAICGLCAMILLVTRHYWQQPEIPRIALLPVGLLLLVWLQFALGRVEYLSQALVATMYFLWMAGLIMLGRSLQKELGMPLLATVLAAFLLCGCELAALTGFAQQYGWSNYVFDRMVALKTGVAIAGNSGQPNHYADYITLGLVSLGLLYFRWRLRAWQVVLLASPLLFVLVLSGSRSVWLFLPTLSAMAFLWQRRDKSCLPLLRYSLLLVLGFGLMHFVVQIPELASGSGNVTSAGRLIKEVSNLAGRVSGSGAAAVAGSSFRLSVWHEAWLILTQYPVLGAGWGQFAWQHFMLAPVLHNPNLTQIYVNAHNFIMQIAAEMGLAGLIVLLGTLALWFRQARNMQLTAYHWWAYGLFAVPVIHGLLEYPLWYTYFLGVVALTLGMLDGTVYRPKWRMAGRISLAAMLLIGALSLSLMWTGYRKLEDWNHYIPSESERDNSYEQRMSLLRVRNLLLTMPKAQALFLKPYIEYMLTLAGWDHLADNLALNERVMHFWPAAQVTYREAVLLTRLGRYAESREQMERAIWSDPNQFQGVLKRLKILAGMDSDPTRFPALLEFAQQKYEERQNWNRTHSSSH
jgi:Virulence factor membrane-bound polymerase, C-terminal/O-Antigen ligase